MVAAAEDIEEGGVSALINVQLSYLVILQVKKSEILNVYKFASHNLLVHVGLFDAGIRNIRAQLKPSPFN